MNMTKKTAERSRPRTSYVERSDSRWQPTSEAIRKLPRLEPTAMGFDLGGTSMGRLPVPDFLSDPMLPASLSVKGGPNPAEAGFLTLPRGFELGDGRRIRIEDLEVVAGEMGIRFRTLP